jgi:GntR family transcriptional repressor for pyruvate dehydrogenase complex
MRLQVIRSRSLADQVFGQLAAEILSGRYQPGEHLPPERTLAEIFNVNRQVVREATKRLAQAGLVKISQGEGTKVLDFRDSAGLDLLGLMAEYTDGTIAVARYWLAVMEMRNALAADIIRLCTLRASQELRDQILEIAHAMQNAATDHELFALEMRFWDLLLEGANNIAYRLAYNSLKKSALSVPQQTMRWSLFEVRECDYRVPLAKAIASGDTAKAEARARSDLRGTLGRYSRHKKELKDDKAKAPPLRRKSSKL